MADQLAQALEDVSAQFKGTDNDLKSQALQALNRALQSIAKPGPDEQTDADAASLNDATALLKLSLKTNNVRVTTAGLQCTATFLELLHALLSANDGQGQGDNDPHYQLLRDAITTLVPSPGGLMTILADSKESIRDQARTALIAAGIAAATYELREQTTAQEKSITSFLDKVVKEQGLAGKNAKTREQSIGYVSSLQNKFPSLPLRPWVPLLVGLLEDPDSTVREASRECIITVFTAAHISAAAKSDLKRELLKKGVRKTTSDAILKGVLGGGSVTGTPGSGVKSSASMSTIASTTGSAHSRAGSMDGDHETSRISLSSSVSSLQKPVAPPANSGSNTAGAPSKPVKGERLLKAPKAMTNEDILAQIEAQAEAAAASAPASDGDSNTVQTVYIASTKDLEMEFAAMQPCFQGKESEHNWQDRQKAIFRLRGILLDDAIRGQFRGDFVTGLRTVQDGIIKALNSLRTTLAAAACQLVLELVRTLRHSLDPLYDPLLSSLVKLASLTKKSIAASTQEGVTALLQNCSYHGKTLSLLSANFIDVSNVQTRQYMIQHVRTLLETHGAHHKTSLESSGGLDILDKLIRRALGDANPAVRDTARLTFWVFNGIWPVVASSILDSLDAGARKQLEKAAPGVQARIPSASKLTAASRTPSASCAAAKPPARQSVRDLINSKRAALAASNSGQPAESSDELANGATSGAPSNSQISGARPSPPSVRASGSSATSRRQSALGSPSPTAQRSRPSSVYGGLASSASPKTTPPSVSTPRMRASPSSPSLSPVTRQTGLMRERSMSGGSTGSRGSASGAKSSPLCPAASPKRSAGDPLSARTMPRVSLEARSLQRTPQRPLPTNPHDVSPSQTPMPPSPTLLAMAQNGDFSNLEGYTLDIANTVPLAHDVSSDDGSVDLHRFDESPNRTAVDPLVNGDTERRQRVNREVLEGDDSADTSRILDHLLETSLILPNTRSSNDTIFPEADEALKGQAEQAEQTAHRFLELIEPDDDESADMTIVHHADPNESSREEHSIDANISTSLTASGASVTSPKDLNGPNGNGSASTPLVKKLQSLHLQDSPAPGKPALGAQYRPAEEDWWLTKANLLVVKSPSIAFEPDEPKLPMELASTMARLESQTVSTADLLKLSRFSRDNPHSDDENTATGTTDSIWYHERLFGKMFDGTSSSLRREEDDEKTEPSLILLLNLVTHQNTLLGGRESEVIGLLLNLRRRPHKGTAAAAEVVMRLFIGQLEPLYALASLRTSLESHLRAFTHPQKPGKIDLATSHSYSMALKAVGGCFSQLESEVLEEELLRVRDMIMNALNNQDFPHLRQSATSTLIQAHKVLQDDNRLFDMLGSLSKSQIHLCTYLFARER